MQMTLRKLLIYCGLILFGIIGWGFVASEEKRRLRPPPGVTTLAKFASVMPQPTHLSIVEDGGSEYVIWIGGLAHWSLPSGPACYVFDRSGNLVEWNTETGDGQPTTRFLRRAWDAKQYTIEEAIQVTREE